MNEKWENEEAKKFEVTIFRDLDDKETKEYKVEDLRCLLKQALPIGFFLKIKEIKED